MRADKIVVNGAVEKGFEGVAAEFRRNFTDRGEIGAACTIYLEGKKVVDLWGGYRDKNAGSPWTEDTLVPVFSTTKGLSAMAIALAHSRGYLDYDESVCTYWPEFAQNGKEKITIRQLLSHQAGLSAIDEPLDLKTIADHDAMARILARQKPAWKPGTKQGYHCWDLGWFQSEILRRVDPKHRGLQRFFHDEIAQPLGIEFFIGLPENMPGSRIADLIPFKQYEMLFNLDRFSPVMILSLMIPGSLTARTFLNPAFAGKHANFNRRDVRSIEMGSGNGIGDARGIAKAYGEFATGGKALGLRKETLDCLESAPAPPESGFKDIVLRTEMAFSLGFMKPFEHHPFGSSYRSYGGFGAGGSAGFADPEKQVGYAYVMNKMGLHMTDDAREVALRNSFYRCIEKS